MAFSSWAPCTGALLKDGVSYLPPLNAECQKTPFLTVQNSYLILLMLSARRARGMFCLSVCESECLCSLQDEQLKMLVRHYGQNDWKFLASHFPVSDPLPRWEL